jgi:hypothetical protein
MPQKCRLCLKEASLCKSHIIPEFCFKPFYDHAHRYIEITDVKKGKVRKAQKGRWERLLCRDCEVRISRLERYARRLFADPLPPKLPGTQRVRQHHRLTYGPLKLFFLSILWRSSVSTDPFFKHVSLGPHEEKIRLMLLNTDAGPPNKYAVMIFALQFDGNPLPDFMVEPTPMKIGAQRCYRFVVTGFVILMFVGSHDPPEKFLRHVLSPNRPIETYDNELGDFGFLREVWNKSAETTRDVEI